MRIVSLLPAATEIVIALGLDDELVGVSNGWADPRRPQPYPVVTHPARSGGGERIDADALATAAPDLVLMGDGSDGSIDARQLERALGELTPSVLTLAPGSVEGVLNAIVAVGAMTEAEDEALEVVEDLRERLKVLPEVVVGRRDHGYRPPRVVVLDAVDPPRAAGHWIPDQVRLAGGWELLGQAGEPGRETTWDAVGEVDPEVLVLLPDGLPLRVATAAWDETPRPAAWSGLRAVREGRAFLVDGGAFALAGPRVIDGIEILAELLDPAAFDGMAPPDTWVRAGVTPPMSHQAPPAQYRATFDCLWCGTAWTSRGPNDLEGWAQLCPTCLGKAGGNPFLRARVRRALAARVSVSQAETAADAARAHVARSASPAAPPPARPPARAPEAAFPDDWFLRRGPFELGAIHDTAWAAELDAATRWLDELGLRGRVVEPAAGIGFFSPLLADAAELFAYDPDGEALDLARDRLAAHRLRAHLHVADPWAPPVPDPGPADGLLAAFLLGRVRGAGLDPAVATLRSRLRPGGRLAVIDLLPDAHGGPPPGVAWTWHDPAVVEASLRRAGLMDVVVATSGRFFLEATGVAP